MSRPTYRIEFAPAAARQFRRLTKQIQKRLRPKIDALATDPRPVGVEKLTDIENTYRVRVGDYRIVYEIRDRDLYILVVKVAHRREAC